MWVLTHRYFSFYTEAVIWFDYCISSLYLTVSTLAVEHVFAVGHL